MFGIDSTELLVIVVVALVVIGPKDLPRVLYKVGKVVGQGRAMARHFRTGIDAMIREAELEDLQKQWDKENARIMSAYPAQDAVMTEKPLVEGEFVPPPVELPAPEPAAPADPLVEAVRQSQAPHVEEASGAPSAAEPAKSHDAP